MILTRARLCSAGADYADGEALFPMRPEEDPVCSDRELLTFKMSRSEQDSSVSVLPLRGHSQVASM